MGKQAHRQDDPEHDFIIQLATMPVDAVARQQSLLDQRRLDNLLQSRQTIQDATSLVSRKGGASLPRHSHSLLEPRFVRKPKVSRAVACAKTNGIAANLK